MIATLTQSASPRFIAYAVIDPQIGVIRIANRAYCDGMVWAARQFGKQGLKIRRVLFRQRPTFRRSLIKRAA